MKDYTKAPGQRSSTAANPLGLGSGGQSRAVPLLLENGGGGRRRPAAAKRAQTAQTKTTMTATSGALKRPINPRRTPSSSEILAHRVRSQMLAKAATPSQAAKKKVGGTNTTSKAETKKAPVAAKKK